MTELDIYRGVLSVATLLLLACLCSENRKKIPFKTLAFGLVGQVLIAVLLLKVPPAQQVFLILGHAVDALSRATLAGTAFVFGYVGGGPAPFEQIHPENAFGLAFQAMPVVMVITALSAVLYQWRILPWVVRALSQPLTRWFGVGGAVGMSAAAMPFLGMVESPLLIRPYLAHLSRGELFILMTGGMSTIAGSVMIVYATFLKGIIPDPIGHLVTSALMGIPLAIAIAKVMCPDTGHTEGDVVVGRYGGVVDAAMQGTMDGVRIVVGIVAVLLVAVAFVHLVNGVLGAFPGELSLQRLAGWALAPLAWAMGVPMTELAAAGALLGEKIVLNELIAFSDLSHLPPDALSGADAIDFGLCPVQFQ